MLKVIDVRIKDIVLTSMGGKCQVCDYDKCKAALEIHHVNPSEKEYSINKIKSWDKICEELPKCVLLCANCHREVHYNNLSIPKSYFKFDLMMAENMRRKTAVENMAETAKKARIALSEATKQKRENRKIFILSEKIDLSKHGWNIHLGDELGISPQKARARVKYHLPDFYNSDQVNKNNGSVAQPGRAFDR